MSDIGDLVELQGDPKLTKTANGSIKTTSANNVLTCLKSDYNLNTHLMHNEFSQEHEIVKDMKLGNTQFKKGEVPANFDSVLNVYFDSEIGVAFSAKAMFDGLETFFSERSYNPVIDFMESSYESWDGKKRIDKLFQDYLGADDTPLVSKIAQVWLVGAVAKAYQPFTKFDYVLDLVGGQGVGKTSLLQKIGGKWYTDSVTDFKNKDNYDIMLQSLIVNDDEMVASNRMTFAETKSFISKTELRFRKPYMKRSQLFAKNFVMARTTNEIEYLRDKTGERRFLPVLANGKNQKTHPMEMKDDDVVQIWGEAVSLYKNGSSLILSDDEEAAMEVYREHFTYRDEIEQQVLEYLDMPVPFEWNSWPTYKQHQYTSKYFSNEIPDEGFGECQQDRVATRDIMYNLFMRSSNDQKLSKKINFLMGSLDEWNKGVYRINGKSVKGYRRVAN